MERRLADVLQIRQGEIKPRNEAKEIVDHVFGGIRPTLSYGQYMNWCMKNKRPPSRDEYLRIVELSGFSGDDGPNGAA